MNTLTPSECELVTGGFRLHPRAAVDCVPFEDVLRESDASITLGLSIEPTPADGNSPPVVMGKLNPKVSHAVRARSLRSE
jgi:hypothetical protein